VLTRLQGWQAIPMEKGEIGGIRTPKPLNRLSQNSAWVIMSAIWPARQNSNRSPQWGVPANGWNYYSFITPKQHTIIQVNNIEISLSRGFLFCFCFWHPIFCSRPETKPENRFLRRLIHRMSIPGYWIPRGIKLQNFPISPILPPKHPKSGVNRHFQA